MVQQTASGQGGGSQGLLPTAPRGEVVYGVDRRAVAGVWGQEFRQFIVWRLLASHPKYSVHMPQGTGDANTLQAFDHPTWGYNR